MRGGPLTTPEVGSGSVPVASMLTTTAEPLAAVSIESDRCPSRRLAFDRHRLHAPIYCHQNASDQDGRDDEVRVGDGRPFEETFEARLL